MWLGYVDKRSLNSRSECSQYSGQEDLETTSEFLRKGQQMRLQTKEILLTSNNNQCCSLILYWSSTSFSNFGAIKRKWFVF